MRKIPFLRPNLVKQDTFTNYLAQIEQSRLYSNYGPLNTLFENRVLTEYYEGNGAVLTVNNATSGLMLAINQSKRPKGRFALMPSFTFSATPLAAMWCGLEPYFVDVNKDDWCMNEELVKDSLTKLGDEVAVVVPYATFGTDLDLSFYKQIHESGIPVVFDAAPSFGTSGRSGSFGKNFPGPIVYSFHATKSFGIGEGGLVYSADKDLISQIRQAGNFGFSTNRETISQGLNSKLSEYSAAVALATLDAFPEKSRKRQQIHQWYLEQFQQTPVLKNEWQLQKSEGDIAHQFMPVLCPNDQSNLDFVKLLADNQIEARTYFSPSCHQQKFFTSFNRTVMPVTNNISGRIMSLPLWEEMKKSDIVQVTQVLAKGLES
ncbi:aminotransferase class I/II-fold pyridoxal phosphate-dependent enzyme [Peribacillus sp. ACCC06369]|uniref:DegT/DnrJ/EryC1/StrS family aminotransferase n=1 Tax=Peribacillus sp. ACCC06369 TaxID=3055860 RepID=UPI0025A275D7|nr:aminotransferase class I/II-fold pyridoxal phosphate-dependent enzyme [Peribacillus sp. ACCC06369]MDM5356380.1 aminotransferase class I/II-fold pyridoxal phosphate-dependent enzyme [Peribacillus sp. ACCC06369]